MGRKLDNWLAGYISYTDHLESPLRLRTWAGIGAICAALQRKVWARTKGQDLYATMYLALVGPPGIGKGNAVKPAIRVLGEIREVKLSPSGLTRRSFYDELEASVRDPVDLGRCGIEEHCSLTAFIEELGVFLKSGDTDFFSSLCAIYDAPDWFVYKTHGAGENKVPNAWFSMVACATPRALKDVLTDNMMEMGLAARMILAFSDERIEVPLFDEPPGKEGLFSALVSDLQQIARIKGAYTFSTSGKEALEEWSRNGLRPIPLDPRFIHYNVRRYTHAVKLCMILAAARSDDLIITDREVNEAKSILLEAERVMPKAIESIGANPLLMQQQLGIKLINKWWRDHGEGMPEHKLRQHLSFEVHPHYVDSVVDNLAFAKWVSVGPEKKPHRTFYPMTVRKKEGSDEEKKDS